MIKQDFLEGRITVYNADCLDVMKNMEGKSIDLVLTDPPYFADYAKETYAGAKISTTGIKRNQFRSDHWEIPSEEYFDEFYRISKNQIIWGINYYEKYARSVGRIIWDKVNDTSTFSKAEIALCSFGIGVHMFRFMWNGMLQGDMKNKETKIHPCQKPVALMSWCLNQYSKENELIFDGYMGSGSVAIAAIKTNRTLIGCELDPIYFEKMCHRIEEELKQGRLF